MNLQDMHAFVAVAETGSISRAALRLRLSQPATTRRIQNFEAAMGGTALLDRSMKPPVLTPAGRQVLERCRQILRAVGELAASPEDARPRGDLRIGIGHGGEVVLDSPLDELRRAFPELRLQITTNWTRWLIEELRNGDIDCAIGLVSDDHRVPKSIEATSLGSESIVILAARDARLPRRRGGLRLNDLADHEWILNPPGCAYRLALERAFDRAALPLRIAAEVFGRELQFSLIARNAGLGLVPRRQIEGTPQRRRFRAIAVEDFRLQATFALLHRPALGPIAPAIEFLRTRVARQLRGHK